MAENTHILAQLPSALLPWYKENKRDLPWRHDREPYHIWLSEIMLQQTRVEAVKGYYSRFLESVPDIKSLANAEDELLHKLWEGLGYYSRVRNLKKAAAVIEKDYGGVFPGTYTEAIALPGIGAYTAGAVCSIAFGLPTPAVDGNVLRVTSRILNDHTPIEDPKLKKRVTDELAAVYPEEAGEFTQALMELGATVCGPNRAPDCEACPCKGFCCGYKLGTAKELPVRKTKKERRQEDMTVLLLCCDGKYALRKRPKEGLLADLWEFPNFPGKTDIPALLKKVEELGLKPKEILRQMEKKHIFTHIQWNMCGVYLEVGHCGADYIWMTPEQIDTAAALPTAFRQFWEEVRIQDR